MALDAESLQTLETLSKSWKVSNAEVMRRSLKIAKEKEPEPPQMTPREALLWLSENGISKEEAENWKAEVRAEREAWRDSWADYEAPRH